MYVYIHEHDTCIKIEHENDQHKECMNDMCTWYKITIFIYTSNKIYWYNTCNLAHDGN